MQTFLSLLEQGVPSLTLLDMAKKKSKSSAMQYSLQMSSAAQRTYRNTSILSGDLLPQMKGVDICRVLVMSDGRRDCQVEECSLCSDAVFAVVERQS